MEEMSSEALDCAAVAELFDAYTDGDIDAGTASRVREHLDGCPECRQLYSDLAAVRAAVADSKYEVPDRLHDKIMAGVRREQKAERRAASRRRLVRIAGLGTAALLCITIGMTALIRHIPSFGNDADNIYLSGGLEITYPTNNEYSSEMSGTRLPAETDNSNWDNIQKEEIETGAASAPDGLDGATCEAEKPSADKEVNDPLYSVSDTIATPSDLPTEDNSQGKPADSVTYISGEWTMSVDGKDYLLNLSDSGSFNYSLGNNIILSGKYYIVGERMVFESSGEYTFFDYSIDKGRLHLTYISGARLF